MSTYKFAIREMLFRYAEVEIEAESLQEAMAQLAEDVPSPDFYWSTATRDMMVLEVSVDDEEVLEDTRSREDGTLYDIWPKKLVEAGRVWEGSGEDGGEYLIEEMPRSVQELIDEEEDQAE